MITFEDQNREWERIQDARLDDKLDRWEYEEYLNKLSDDEKRRDNHAEKP